MYGQQRSYNDHNESIYNLITPVQEKAVKPPMYKSQYPPTAPPTCSTFGSATVSQIKLANVAGDYDVQPLNHRHKKEGALMGTGSHYSDPTKFVQKNSKAPLPEPVKFDYGSRRKPSLDFKSPPKPSPTKKNYVKENALQAIMSKPPSIDNGDVDYTKKADYGKRPAYLDQVAQELKEEQDYIQTIMMAERAQYTSNQPKMRLLSEEDRLELLNNLKKKWDSIDKMYQLQTHVVDLDTIGKVRRKEEYESQLQQLEKSIEKLSKKNVFVQDDYQW